MKWFLGIASAIGALLVAGLFTSIGQSRQEVKADPAVKATHTLTASGSGTAKVGADAAKITLKIEASGGDMKAARKALDEQAGKLKEALEGLKLGVEIRPMAIETSQQQNGFGIGGGFGGGGFAPPFGPMQAVPPAIPINPVAPPALPRMPNLNDNFISAPLIAQARAPAPDRAPAPNAPVADPNVPPGPPMPPFGGIGIGGPANFGRAFHLIQGFVVTIKNNDAAKLVDGVNKMQFAAAEAGAQLPTANNNQFPQMGGFGIGGGGGFGVVGGFPGNLQNQTGPRVVFFRADDKETRRKALELAVADAMANAKAMAKGADVKIIDTIAINDPPATGSGQPLLSGREIPSDDSTGELEVTVKVTVVCSY